MEYYCLVKSNVALSVKEKSNLTRHQDKGRKDKGRKTEREKQKKTRKTEQRRAPPAPLAPPISPLYGQPGMK
jgi:hypothetical protein